MLLSNHGCSDVIQQHFWNDGKHKVKFLVHTGARIRLVICGHRGCLLQKYMSEVEEDLDGGWRGRSTTFINANTFMWHFKYEHIVDDHNNQCYQKPRLEDKWRTTTLS